MSAKRCILTHTTSVVRSMDAAQNLAWSGYGRKHLELTAGNPEQFDEAQVATM